MACKRLEKAGLLTRTRQTDDERVVQVALTEAGCTRIDAGRQQRRDALAQLLAVLDQDEQQALHALIARLLHAAEAQGFANKGSTIITNNDKNGNQPGEEL
jgi:DNA-binding MarR family transcriptional regulator